MQKLRTIVGHSKQISELQRDIDIDNISHAYLFSGKRHLGKMTVAYWFAEKLLSSGFSSEEQERVRNSIERLTHPDLFVLDALWIEKKQEDLVFLSHYSNISQAHRSKKSSPAKTNTIGIDDIRVLQERLHETGLGKWRCCLIRSIERMQDTAANAFLKILEEPPVGLVFLLTTEAQSSLLPTLISRTRMINFYSCAYSDLQPLLEESDEDMSFILHLAKGAPGIAQNLSDNPDALIREKQVYSAAQKFWEATNLKERLSLLAPLNERGEESEKLLLHLALTLQKQTSSYRNKWTKAFISFLKGYKTNANRQLLLQRLALEVGE